MDQPVSLRSVFERWRAANKRAEGTYKLRDCALNALAKFGIVTLNDACNPGHVAAYIEARGAAGKHERTIAKEVVTITVLLDYLCKTRELDRSVYHAIVELCPKPKRKKKYSATTLEEHECDLLYKTLLALGQKEAALALRIVQYAGLRTSETVGLCVEHIDFGRKHILVRADSRVRGIAGHKTGERLVPLVRELVEVLKESNLPERGPIFPCTRATKTNRTVRHADTFRLAFRLAAKVAGITMPIDFKILRRTRETTWAALPDMKRNYLSMIMGHDATIGEEVYQRVRAGYDACCETPQPHKTTKAMKAPQGFTPTRALTPAEVAELQALERELLARRDREAT